MKISFIGAATTSLLAVLAGGVSAQPIQVQVNGSPVAFEGAGPVERNDSVLVPLRGVFEAMGATVDWDQTSHVVRAYRGGESVLLPIGSTEATVGGQPVTLTQPAVIVGGSTMVPLRFVAESLGAHVDWIADSDLVSIHTSDVAEATPPPASYEPANLSTITGRVASTSRESDGDRVIQLDDGQRIRLTDDAHIVVNDHSGDFGDIAAGDRVSIRMNTDSNRAVRIAVIPGRAPETFGVGMAPEIMSPDSGTVVGDRLTVTGRAYPGATVRLKVAYTGRANDGGYAINGTTSTRDVVADDNGNWATTLRLTNNADNIDDDTVHYTIEARTVAPDGDLSPMDSISVGGGRVYAHRRLQ